MSTRLPVFEVLGERATCCNRCGTHWSDDVPMRYRRTEVQGCPLYAVCAGCGHIFKPVAGKPGRELTPMEKLEMREWNERGGGKAKLMHESLVERMIG